jgi:hypothetical protein
LAAVRHLWEEGSAIINSLAFRAILSPFGVVVLVLALAPAGCRKPEPRQNGQSGAPLDAAAEKEPSSLSVQVRDARGHAYLLFEQRPPALAVRVTRPSPEDSSILLAVAGTYTSPEGRSEGVVAIDGRIVEHQPKPWEGLLVVENGIPTLRRAEIAMLEGEALKKLIGSQRSLIQGHLLVDGVVLPLKPSPSLRRRAIATRADRSFFFAESLGPLPLSEFAADLVVLGARLALNLDMGQWSEGFYRDPITGQVRSLGDDHRQTARQTNWLVLLQRAR